MISLPVVVEPSVRAVAGFDVEVNVRVVPSVDFVTVEVVDVVFLSVDATPLLKIQTKQRKISQIQFEFRISYRNLYLPKRFACSRCSRCCCFLFQWF